MKEQYQVPVSQAIQLWDCLKTLRVRSKEVDLDYKPYMSFGEHKFRVRVPATSVMDFGVVFGRADELCTITLHDFKDKIQHLLECQATIESFRASQEKSA